MRIINFIKNHAELILISFTILFLELLLIRLVATEIRIFAYLSNLVLLAVFLGSGLGMLIKRRLPLFLSSFLLLIVLAIISLKLFSGVTDWLSPLSESFVWFQAPAASFWGVAAGLVLTLVLFFLVAAVFLPLGQRLGGLLNAGQNSVLLYSLNIIGSLLGMWVFQGFSVLAISPFLGIVLGQALLICLENKEKRHWSVLFLFLSVIFAFFSVGPASQKVVWSPYQKLTLSSLAESQFSSSGYLLQVNNVGYMGLLDLSDDYLKKAGEYLKEKNLLPSFNGSTALTIDTEQSRSINLRFFDQYSLPFILKPDSRQVLIVGAGAGNDAAAALRSSMPEIDAVEIDPKILELGRSFHPEKPYSSSAVKTIVEDGRSFFKTTTKQYDLVIMGLADSHTLSSSLTNLQLDNYLYTRESFGEIKNILKPGGLLFISFDVRRPWIGQRIQSGLEEIFNQKPLVFSLQDQSIFGWGGVVFAVGREPGVLNQYLAQNKNLADFIRSRETSFSGEINHLSDNWPYLYLDRPRLPKIHLLVFASLLAALGLCRRFVAGQGKIDFQMLFLGAGFLLYEFQNINRTALIFGNTWQTSLLTITAVLLFILLANLIYFFKPIPPKLSYVFLFIFLGLQFFIPLAVFNSLTGPVKTVVASFWLNLPFFFSSLIFISLFSLSRDKASALGSNLLGSVVGGMFSAFSFVWGIKSVLIISLLLYGFSLTGFLKIGKIKH